MAALLPTDFGSQAAYSTYYLALLDVHDRIKPNMTAFEEAEMKAALNLVPRADVTKLFAVVSGNWNTAGNWFPSGVPGSGAIVLIGEGCTCIYNTNSVLTELFTVRIDGTLKSDPTVDTAMLFDTMVITQLGNLIDGTRATPVAANKVHQWIIATSNGAIDVSWDTFMQSRGILSLGQVSMWGARKTHGLEVATRDAPDTGATSLTLASEPEGWLVGDDIVITSTRYAGAHNEAPFELPLQNERRTLTSVSGATLGWSGGLTYSHVAPRALGNGTTKLIDWMECRAHVINLTRNIVIKPDDITASSNHRGHTMQMHNPAGWSARYVEVADLGRTVKLGGFPGRLFYAANATTGGNPVDLTSSPWWTGSVIRLSASGPTFRLRYALTATGAGTLTIVGTDKTGGAQSETVNYPDGASGAATIKHFLSITSITPSTNVTFSYYNYIGINAISRQRNENGVRTFGTDSEDLIYATIHTTDNLQGRYPFHWHKMGVSGSILTDPPVLEGCSFHGSPGWLVAQHQTHGIIKKCVAFDAQGAGFVAEDGNETGLWEDNISCHNFGNNEDDLKGGSEMFDPAREGVAFWFASRMMHTSGNKAFGSRLGFGYTTRPVQNHNVGANHQLDQATATLGKLTALDLTNFPIAHFDGNECGACHIGVLVVKNFPEQGHDLRTKLTNQKIWSCKYGGDVSYTAHYTYTNWDILYGFYDGSFGPAGTYGFILPNNVSDQVFVDITIEGTAVGMNVTHEHVTGPEVITDGQAGIHFVNVIAIDCDDDYLAFDAGFGDVILDSEDLLPGPATITGVALADNEIEGTKSDELGSRAFPFGEETIAPTGVDVELFWMQSYGYYTQGATKYAMIDVWFTSGLTGVPNKIILPYDVSALALGSYTNHGATDISNDTPPVLADFAVSLARNTNEVIDIVGRATGNTVRFGGFQRPMRTYLVDNGDGTITAVPLADEEYTETCYVWVDDINGNTTRATMTLNVEKYKPKLGFPG